MVAYTNYQTVIEEVNTFVDEAIDSVYALVMRL